MNNTERYFLSITESAVAVPAKPDNRIIAVAYPTKEGVYVLHRKPVFGVIVDNRDIIFEEEQGTRFIRRENHEPVYIWCQNPLDDVTTVKIYSIHNPEVKWEPFSPA